MRRVNVTVSGIVQGVGYRYSLHATAIEAGISGWVRNRTDGSVEAELQGDDDAVQRVLAWMTTGPRGARVTDTRATDLDVDRAAASGFEIRATG